MFWDYCCPIKKTDDKTRLQISSNGTISCSGSVNMPNVITATQRLICTCLLCELLLKAAAIVGSVWGMWADGGEDLMPEPESCRVRSPAQTGCWHHTLPTPGGGAEQTSWHSPASTDTSAAFRARGNKHHLKQLLGSFWSVLRFYSLDHFNSNRNLPQTAAAVIYEQNV